MNDCCAIWRNVRIALAVVFPAVLLFPGHAPGAEPPEDLLKFVESKRTELAEREESLKREEQRLQALRKDVDERIDRYTVILRKIESALANIETVRGERIDAVVKTYEAMPAENAAARIEALDRPTALLILGRMKSKKAAAILALIAPPKAAEITRHLTELHRDR